MKKKILIIALILILIIGLFSNKTISYADEIGTVTLSLIPDKTVVSPRR